MSNYTLRERALDAIEILRTRSNAVEFKLTINCSEGASVPLIYIYSMTPSRIHWHKTDSISFISDNFDSFIGNLKETLNRIYSLSDIDNPYLESKVNDIVYCFSDMYFIGKLENENSKSYPTPEITGIDSITLTAKRVVTTDTLREHEKELSLFLLNKFGFADGSMDLIKEIWKLINVPPSIKSQMIVADDLHQVMFKTTKDEDIVNYILEPYMGNSSTQSFLRFLTVHFNPLYINSLELDPASLETIKLSRTMSHSHALNRYDDIYKTYLTNGILDHLVTEAGLDNQTLTNSYRFSEALKSIAKEI